MRLLRVEDDEKIAFFIRNGLMEDGFAVDHVANGEDGLHMAFTESYDRAFIDLMLPKLDGLTLIEAMRKRKGTQRNRRACRGPALLATVGTQLLCGQRLRLILSNHNLQIIFL